MFSRRDVEKHVSDIRNAGIEGIEIGEPYMFGLALQVFDPVSGQVIQVCRPHRSDLGQPEILLPVAQVAAAVTGARNAQLQQDRNRGITRDQKTGEVLPAGPRPARPITTAGEQHLQRTAAAEAAAAAQPAPAPAAPAAALPDEPEPDAPDAPAPNAVG